MINYQCHICEQCGLYHGKYKKCKIEVPIKNWKESAKLMNKIAEDYKNQNVIQLISDNCYSLHDIFYLVGICFTFDPDEEQQTYRTPERLIREGKGNCVDASIMVSAILKNKNLPYKMCFGSYKPDSPTHVWIECGGKVIDCVSGRNKRNKYFLPENYDKKINLPYIYTLEF